MFKINNQDYSKGFFIRLVEISDNTTKLSRISDIAFGRKEMKIFETIHFIETNEPASDNKINYRVVVSLYSAYDGLKIIDRFSRRSSYSSVYGSKDVNLIKEDNYAEVFESENSKFYPKVIFKDDSTRYSAEFKCDYMIASITDYTFNSEYSREYRFIQCN